jgi:predicted ribosome quality control (RQC) complex YloA/Tae2 family protein
MHQAEIERLGKRVAELERSLDDMYIMLNALEGNGDLIYQITQYIARRDGVSESEVAFR